MDNTIKYSKEFFDLTKKQVAVYCGILGAIIGMLIQGTIGFSGILLLGGFYLIMKFFTSKKEVKE